ncbi:MAG: NAD(+)/NADH kinase [Desulfobulbaceae bacterium]|nr:MAG: NAD(+)/NADH kinase [Desulfobulbaceae bacterium]
MPIHPAPYNIIENFQVKTVGIIVKRDSEEAVEFSGVIAETLNHRGITTEFGTITPELDLVLILGGDGTLLHTAESAARYSIPVIGINLGNLGFLTELTRDDTDSAITALLEGEVIMENRQMLKARLISSETSSGFRYALNDVVINKNPLDRLLRLPTSAADKYITTYKADGLIFSTPTGSTAYNLSAGGSLVHPALRSILVTPICPFMLSSRPIILPADQIITSKFVTDDPTSVAKVIVDGMDSWEMKPNDILEIQTAEHDLQLITSSNHDYFSILRNKLKWGSND